jgi:hypothetical protein
VRKGLKQALFCMWEECIQYIIGTSIQKLHLSDNFLKKKIILVVPIGIARLCEINTSWFSK